MWAVRRVAPLDNIPENRMLRAGLPLSVAENFLVVLCAGSAVLLAMLLFLVGGGKGIVAFAGAALGFVFPFILVKRQTTKHEGVQ